MRKKSASPACILTGLKIHVESYLDEAYHFKTFMGDFPGNPVFKAFHFQCRGHRVHPWSGSKIPFGATGLAIESIKLSEVRCQRKTNI